jgi:hypothetical protein
MLIFVIGNHLRESGVKGHSATRTTSYCLLPDIMIPYSYDS